MSATEEVKRRSATQPAQEGSSGKWEDGERSHEYERRRTMLKRRSGTACVSSRLVTGQGWDDQSET